MTDGKLGKGKTASKTASDDNFIRTFLLSPAALAITRIADGRFLNINFSFTGVMGYQPDEILGRTVYDLNIYVDSSERDLLIKTLHEQGEVRNYELRVRSKSGEVRDLLLSMVPTIYDNEEAIISTFVDITERNQAERALTESEALYHALFDNMLNGLAYCRMLYEGDRPLDFIYLSVNRAFEMQTGLKDVAGKRVSEVIPGIRETDPQLFEIYGRVARTGIPEMFETYVEALKMWFEVTVYSPERDHFAAVFNVITERKKAEEDLLQADERLAMAQLAAGAGVWDWDMTTGQLHWSPEFFELFGLDQLRDPPTFDTWRRILHPDDLKAAETRINESIRNHTPLLNQYRIILPTGDVRWIEALGNTTYDERDQAIRMLGICIDITDRKLAEKALQEREALLQDVGNIARIGGWEMDMITRKARWTRTTYDLVGIRPDDPVPGPDEHIGYYVEEDRPIVAEAMRRLVEDDIPLDFEARAEIPGKGLRWFRALGKSERKNGRCARVYGTLQDITERKLAEVALRESEDRFSIAFHASPASQIITTIAEGRIMDVNDAYCRMMGYSHDEFVGRTVSELNLWENQNDREAMIKKLLSDGHIYEMEVATRTSSGEIRTMLASFEQIELKGARCIITTALDITERKHMERAIIDALEANRAIVDHSQIGIIIYRASGQCIAANDSAASILGTTKDQLLGQDFHMIESWRRSGLYESAAQAISTGESVSSEVDITVTSGIRLWLRVIFTPFTSGGELHLMTMFDDFTERKIAEEAVRSSEEKYRELVENLNDTIFAMSSDGVFTYVSPRSLQLTGFAPKDLLGRRFDELVVPEDLPKIMKSFHNTKENRLEPWEFRYFNKDGKIRWGRTSSRPIFQDGKAIGIRGLFTDITERKQAEESLRESEARFRALVDLAPDGILVHTEGRILYANPAMVRILGAESVEDLIGSDYMTRVASEYHDRVRERIRTQRETGLPVPAMEQEYLRMGGSKVPTESIAAPLRFEGRDAHLVFVRDISARRKDEIEKNNLQAQLQQAQKMEAIGRLAGGVAHDFNNLLSVIIGFSELEMFKLKDSDPLKERLNEIFIAGNRAASLTRQLLAFSRRQSQSPEAVSMNSIVLNIEKMLGRLIGEDIELVTKLDEPLHNVLADIGQMEQVIVNLVVNSRDALPSGGRIQIETKNVELDEAYCQHNSEAKPGFYIQLSVSDTGSGMDEKTINHIFEPFFTTKELGRGTGLGLSTVYGIIRQSGGFIDVRSEMGKGTSFEIYLLKTDRQREHGPASVNIDIEAGKGETILVVEDDPTVRQLSAKILANAGYTVIEAPSPIEALRIMNEKGDSIELILSDVMMPGMSGPDLIQMLNEMRPGLKFLYMSGYSEQSLPLQNILRDRAHFISKPFSHKEMLHKIRQLLNNKGSESGT